MHLRLYLVSSSVHHRDLPSFPTRRSSDLPILGENNPYKMFDRIFEGFVGGSDEAIAQLRAERKSVLDRVRSEEHTFELQSQSNLVCRLLLEKKKKKHSCSTTRRLGARVPA